MAFNCFFVGRFCWVLTTAGGPFGRVSECTLSFARSARFHFVFFFCHDKECLLICPKVSMRSCV